MDGHAAHTRPCRCAGAFFPAEAERLRAEVDGYLIAARKAPWPAASPVAIVAPHAGYRFSGALAGAAYASVTQAPERVIVLSPAHRHAFDGLAFPSQDAFRTPLGTVRIDQMACAALASRGLAQDVDAAHDNEHGIETQLPFIRSLWPDVPVVPLVVGAAAPAQIAQTIDLLAGPGTLIVVSSDLSHFLDQSGARAKDTETARLVETGKWAELTSHNACGARGWQGWLASRLGQGTKPLRLGMRDSAWATGDTSRVVGYGAWAYYPIDADMLAGPQRLSLLAAARQALASRLAKGRSPHVSVQTFAAPLQTHAASFVTLTDAGRLRGCIGSLAAHAPLVLDVVENVQKAGLNDPRFAPVSADLLPGLRIKIAALSRATRMDVSSEAEALARIVPGRDGLILASSGKRGTFLPMVWESLPEPRVFLRQLKRKAGLPEDHWADDLSLHRFRAESFAEPDHDDP